MLTTDLGLSGLGLFATNCIALTTHAPVLLFACLTLRFSARLIRGGADLKDSERDFEQDVVSTNDVRLITKASTEADSLLFRPGLIQ